MCIEYQVELNSGDNISILKLLCILLLGILASTSKLNFEYLRGLSLEVGREEQGSLEGHID